MERLPIKRIGFAPDADMGQMATVSVKETVGTSDLPENITQSGINAGFRGRILSKSEKFAEVKQKIPEKPL